MRNSETGEFELVVGNRQLLSGFFIVVLLFAVAFAMGYVVGQNSPRSAKVAVADASAQPVPADAQRPAPVPANPTPQPQETAAAPPSETAPAPAPAADAPPQPVTQPAKEPDTAAPTAAAPAQQPATNGGAAHAYPAPPSAPAGSFWQVIAVAQPDVDVFYKTLKDRGFPTYVEPGTKGLMRVLVGPYNDRESMGKAKDQIEQLGFKPIRK